MEAELKEGKVRVKKNAELQYATFNQQSSLERPVILPPIKFRPPTPSKIKVLNLSPVTTHQFGMVNLRPGATPGQPWVSNVARRVLSN
jgi:hypothetical protein